MVLHPGVRIKAEVIPKSMSVTRAAELMGVGRPALSNLLNGKAALSMKMAARLEKTFDYPKEDLMEMQAQYDAALATQKEVPADIKAYVPRFLEIKANDIEQWVSHKILPRSRLAVFLRTLVNSTGRGLTKVDFPGNDDAERPGWDGFVEATEGTPWIPSGYSYWEFGTNKESMAKAEKDFKKSVRALTDIKEGAQITFVFVTPRCWNKKKEWADSKRREGIWKDVRAYDASDIEQWLEQSLSAQAWFTNETNGIERHNVRSLDKCWLDWVGDSLLPGTLFRPAIEAYKSIVLSRLSKPIIGEPICIAADSVEEALAFLSQLLSENGREELASYRDRVLVFDKPGTFTSLAAGSQNLIPVAFSREVEREFRLHKGPTSFVIHPRNASNVTFNIVLEPVNHQTFNMALTEIGESRDRVLQLEKESGRSLTVLRRRLSKLSAVRTPEWAADQATAEKLIPFLLAGAWDSQNDKDQSGLSSLAGNRPYDVLERNCQNLIRLNDAPVWSVGTYRGVVSKIDLLFAIAPFVTRADLESYFLMAGEVLGEDDPALDLDEGQRWNASMYGKTREFSKVFRDAISETFVLLSVHGQELFKSRLGIDIESKVKGVVNGLLQEPLTTRILEANNRDLPTYAEAAPDEFLTILERDLKLEEPAVVDLFRPVSASLLITNSPSYVGLLWALEGLAWNPDTLTRTVDILAQLSQIEFKDNYLNKPINSLMSIFRAWMPQTAASTQERVSLIKRLVKKFPSVAWALCIAQLGVHDTTGNYNHKPRWRPDGFGFGEPFQTNEPSMAFRDEILQIVLNWGEYTLGMLNGLVTRLPWLSEADQACVWEKIKEWGKSKASDEDKATMREKIRITTFSRFALERCEKEGKTTNLAAMGKAIYAELEPSDLLLKHTWLFLSGLIEESSEDMSNLDCSDNSNFEKHNKHVKNLRMEALREILKNRGFSGVLELSQRKNAALMIAPLLVSDLLSSKELREFLQYIFVSILEGKEDVQSRKSFLSYILRAIVSDDEREVILKSIMQSLPEENAVKLLLLAPFSKSSWRIVDTLSDAAQTNYWDEIQPGLASGNQTHRNEAVERLLQATRPHAAFSYVSFQLTKLDPQILFRLLVKMKQKHKEPSEQFRTDSYRIEEAFKYLNNSPELTLDQKAHLEFFYIEFLAPFGVRTRDCGIPNLERYIALHPEFFVQLIVWGYKRKDDAEDPPEFQASENSGGWAERGCMLLQALECMPIDHYSEWSIADFEKWILTVRELCTQLSRAEIGDLCIGKLLSNAPVGNDGVWPCESVRDVMNNIESESMMDGAFLGVYNSRGVHMRGNGGQQERELAERYRQWGQALRTSHSFVARKLLGRLVETYEREASQNDDEAGIRRRLH
ncbi:HigA family addiction module antitoxin [Neisseriaceae bacterium TC5R-5]|nr:HigA family addiction module antitoxin [Neisseriaceae bacterium TC5R-5]